MTLSTFKQIYKQTLADEISSLTALSEQLKLENRDDEYKFNRVENNIVEIFAQMFEISLKKIKDESNWKTELTTSYLSFFNKIPTAWHTNLEKCKVHGLEEEIFIETLKINKAETIKTMFLTLIEEEKI